MFINRAILIIMLLAFGVYCFVYPSSLFLLATDQVPPGTEWMATMMLVMEGLAITGWVIYNQGWKRGSLAVGAVLAIGFTVELVGENTGFPFGRYHYTDMLAPKLFTVPVGIIFAWLMIVLASYFTARYILARFFPDAGPGFLTVASLSLILISDLLMEPVAYHVSGYWLWDGTGGYYGVPLSNFVGWAFTGLVMVLILQKITGQKSGSYRFSFIPLLLFMMNLFMFTTINISYRFDLAAGVGLLAFPGCTFLLLRGQKVELALPFLLISRRFRRS